MEIKVNEKKKNCKKISNTQKKNLVAMETVEKAIETGIIFFLAETKKTFEFQNKLKLKTKRAKYSIFFPNFKMTLVILRAFF